MQQHQIKCQLLIENREFQNGEKLGMPACNYKFNLARKNAFARFWPKNTSVCLAHFELSEKLSRNKKACMQILQDIIISNLVR